MKDFKVSVVGLGKLGSSLSACFASRGYEVLGYDINEANMPYPTTYVPDLYHISPVYLD